MEKNFIIVHIHKARLLNRGDSPPQSEGGKFTNDFFFNAVIRYNWKEIP